MIKLACLYVIAAFAGEKYGWLTGAVIALCFGLLWSYAQGFYEAWRADTPQKGDK